MPSPAAATSASQQASHSRHHHVFVPRLPQDRALLIALVADRDGGHADNCSATAKDLGVDRRTVRAWRDSLLRDGVLERDRRRYLVRGPAWATVLGSIQWDPIPRKFLRRGHDPAIVRAAAIVHGEGVGFVRQWVRNDAERAELAGVSKPTVILARRLLIAGGFSVLEKVRRGRARLVRTKLPADRSLIWGSPMAEWRADRNASRAAAGARRGGHLVVRGGGHPVVCHHQSPSETYTIKGSAPAQPESGRCAAQESDGARVCEAQKPHGFRDESQPRPGESGESQRLPEAPTASKEARQEIERLRADRQRVMEIVAHRPHRLTGMIEQLLAMARCFDASPFRRRQWAVWLAKKHGQEAIWRTFALLCDVVDGRGRSYVENVGAVVARRLPKLMQSGNEWLSERNRKLTPMAVIGGGGVSQVHVPGRTNGRPRRVRDSRPSLPLGEKPSFRDWLRAAGLPDMLGDRTG